MILTRLASLFAGRDEMRSAGRCTAACEDLPEGLQQQGQGQEQADRHSDGDETAVGGESEPGCCGVFAEA